MKCVYVVCGYGFPKDIQNDQNYDRYLSSAIAVMLEKSSGQAALVILSGGPTNCEPPYEGTEAVAMESWIRRFMGREEMRNRTKGWEIVLEDRSLSSLENLINSNKLIEQRGESGPIVIFCEQTRVDRIKQIATRIFSGREIAIQSIDFDLSKNRRLDSEVLKRKESDALREAMWTLDDPARLVRHHEFFQSRIDFLRKRQSEGVSHVDAVKEWIEREPELLRELMPDHPLLSALIVDRGDSMPEKSKHNFWFWLFLIAVIAVAVIVFYQRPRDNISSSSAITFVPLISTSAPAEVSPEAFAERDGAMLKVLAKSGDGAVILYGFGTCDGLFSIDNPQLSSQGPEYRLHFKETAETPESEGIGNVIINEQGIVRVDVTSTVAERGCKLSVMRR